MIQLCAGRFTALVRWRCPGVPDLELETHQPGFDSAPAAALAANGLGDRALDELVLECSAVTALRDGVAQDGGCLAIVGWVSVCSTVSGVPREWAFERTERFAEHVARLTPVGRFTPYAFRVVDEQTGDDITVEFLITPQGLGILVAASDAWDDPSKLLLA